MADELEFDIAKQNLTNFNNGSTKELKETPLVLAVH